ncbi:TetR/AcrR family transcriptional regulator [Phytohabitans houttuyneae]|uniref:TetR family transcriptional regulator n=1 Tax=Phytohabitans houttuyneae TaxID=1076126 RepID=A0A6V8KQN4_9ACTN|nr:TetR family transcriptional regulator [Phytohabitans houttuyneae]
MSRAVWQVLADKGFGGLTLRAVAAELGSTTGLLTHYFPSKRELLRHALDVAQEQGERLARPDAGAEGLAGLRAALLFVLPLTPEATVMNRVWVSFWDAALGDPELTAYEARRYERWRGLLRPHVEAALRRGELAAGSDVDDVVAGAAAFGHGVVTQALFDPDRFPPERQVALVDQYIAALR